MRAGNAYEARKHDAKGEWRKQAYEDAYLHETGAHPDEAAVNPAKAVAVQ